MNRRDFLTLSALKLPTLGLMAPAMLPLLVGCGPRPVLPGKLGTLQQPAAHWQNQVSADAWDVLFREETESRFSSRLNYEKGAGSYLCAACRQPLFSSTRKYDSGTGWPSFWQALPDALGWRIDRSDGLVRTEYHCARCGGHQGHVFDDGPQPTGLRYCNNGVALTFIAAGDTPPPLRG